MAIVGPTGAGKSTIARLLFRFYDPQGGRILVDGRELRELTQASPPGRDRRRPAGHGPVQRHDRLQHRLRPPRRGARGGRGRGRAAALHDFVAELPDGYATLVGERGLKLSGGEKQRVAIARAILKRPRIFVLDEATSALDSATERAIQANLREVCRGTTTLVIAHRLSTVVDADEILVLDRGRIVERGTHAALLRKDGLYARPVAAAGGGGGARRCRDCGERSLRRPERRVTSP